MTPPKSPAARKNSSAREELGEVPAWGKRFLNAIWVQRAVEEDGRKGMIVTVQTSKLQLGKPTKGDKARVGWFDSTGQWDGMTDEIVDGERLANMMRDHWVLYPKPFVDAPLVAMLLVPLQQDKWSWSHQKVADVKAAVAEAMVQSTARAQNINQLKKAERKRLIFDLGIMAPPRKKTLAPREPQEGAPPKVKKARGAAGTPEETAAHREARLAKRRAAGAAKKARLAEQQQGAVAKKKGAALGVKMIPMKVKAPKVSKADTAAAAAGGVDSTSKKKQGQKASDANAKRGKKQAAATAAAAAAAAAASDGEEDFMPAGKAMKPAATAGDGKEAATSTPNKAAAKKPAAAGARASAAAAGAKKSHKLKA